MYGCPVVPLGLSAQAFAYRKRNHTLPLPRSLRADHSLPARKHTLPERFRQTLQALDFRRQLQRLMARSTIEISEKAGVRYLHFSSAWIQGAMRIQRPNALELPYTREMMAGLLLRAPPWPRQALLIGLGAGSLAKFIYHRLPATRITVVEIDPQVEMIARLHFKLPDDPLRLRVVIADGAEYMLQGDSHHDYILVDGFDRDARAGVLDTLPFYQACRARLSENGLLAVNLLGREHAFEASAERIQRAFDGRAMIFPSCDSGNTIAFAAAGEHVDASHDELIRRANQCLQETGLNLLPTVARLQQEHYLANDRLRF
ncbi:MAG: Spermidine synthase [Candidatus Accumulibacter phosphatis]|uniref:Spermidine synthase n=1 Tax=Candidatus Accumulibacter phosphatis TaxID=327160 RepID=A0A080LUJ7_9PROT|nr:MAG: Spermidine synthase [Candidatus Accumulibacter phosphatis]